MKHQTIFRALVVTLSLSAFPAGHASAAMTGDVSSNSSPLSADAVLAQNELQGAAPYSVIQGNVSTLVGSEEASSVGSAYLLFADSLGFPVINKQVSINQQIAGYVASYGPVNSNPSPVPLPPTAWLLAGGLAAIGLLRTPRPAPKPRLC